MLNCSSYQLSTYDSDGIYNSQPEKKSFYPVITKSEAYLQENNQNQQVASNNNAYYKHVFLKKHCNIN